MPFLKSYFKSFQQVVSNLDVICPALLTGQPALPKTVLLVHTRERKSRKRHLKPAITESFLKGFKTIREECSARHRSLGSD